jgi:hypothetical protein
MEHRVINQMTEHRRQRTEAFDSFSLGPRPAEVLKEEEREVQGKSLWLPPDEEASEAFRERLKIPLSPPLQKGDILM